MIPKRMLFLAPLLLGFLWLGAASVPTATATPGSTPKQQVGKSIFLINIYLLSRIKPVPPVIVLKVGGTGANAQFNAGGGVYEGSIAGRFGARKPPTSAYVASSPVFHFRMEEGETLFVGGNFWDGRATGEKLGNPAADLKHKALSSTH